MMRIIISTAVLVTALAVAGAAAPNVELSIHDGRVWLVAQNATARQILAEWARVGRTRIVNGERVPGGPLTLELTGVPEREALDVVLRMAGGYIAAPRATQVADASVFDRLVIVPTSAPQAPPSPAAPPFRQPTPTQTFPPPQQTFPQPAPLTVTPGVQRIIGPDGLPVPDDQQEVPPGAQPRAQPFVPLPPGFANPPQVPPQQRVPPAQAPATGGANPTMPPGAAPVPGVIVPPPGQPGTQQTQPPRR